MEITDQESDSVSRADQASDNVRRADQPLVCVICSDCCYQVQQKLSQVFFRFKKVESWFACNHSNTAVDAGAAIDKH